MMARLQQYLSARAENVAAALLALLFLSFMLQIVSRYVVNHPIGWTLEACLIAWLWIVFWCSAFLLKDEDHVRFDMVYLAVGPRTRRVFAGIVAVVLIAAFAISLPATIDYIHFMKIQKSATLKIRLDLIFMVYAFFAVAVIGHYAQRLLLIVLGKPFDETEGDREAGHIPYE